MDALRFEERERRTAHQMVLDTLRRAILDGSLLGGTRLVQAEIAAQLEVSTTPVREALRDLASEGLVRLDAHRGAEVHKASAEELEEIYELRCILEPEAVRRAATKITDDELRQIDELQQQMDAEPDVVRWTELNRTFHRTIARAAGSQRLTDALHRLEDAAALYVGVSLRRTGARLDSGNEQHHALIDALGRRDGDAAAAVMLEHLDHTLAIARAGLGSDDDGPTDADR